MTPSTCSATCGTWVMSITLMISRTFITGRPYSSLPRLNVRYLPPCADPACAGVPVASRASVASMSVSFVVLSVPNPNGLRGGSRCVLLDQRQQAAGVENQADAAITQNRAAGNAAHAAEHVAEVLDHHFLFADQLVDHQ